MIGAQFDLVGRHSIVKGLPWAFAFTRKVKKTGQPLNLTGCAARLVIIDPLAPAADPLVFTTDSGHITLGGAAGTVAIALPEAVTSAITASRAKYRLYFTDSLGVETLHLRGALGLLEDD